MFETLNTPAEAYNYKLGAALKMEETVLKILDSAIEEGKDAKATEILRKHRNESEQHVQNVEQAFRLLGGEPDRSPCPAIDGLQAEGKANAKKANEALLDVILLQGAVEVEHHEIGAYENLLIGARAMGREDVAEVLERNLESERRALQLASEVQEKLAAAVPQQPEPQGLADKVKRAL